ncbi:MAG: hypothetical protein JSV86_00985, partial [Gemmatimonadota bacterium]
MRRGIRTTSYFVILAAAGLVACGPPKYTIVQVYDRERDIKATRMRHNAIDSDVSIDGVKLERAGAARYGLRVYRVG